MCFPFKLDDNKLDDNKLDDNEPDDKGQPHQHRSFTKWLKVD